MTEKTKSEQHLIQLAVTGDRAAFANLVAMHYDMIYRTAYKWSGNEADAEDITQEVCVKLGKAIKSFKGEAALTSWLYRITLNTTHDMKRSSASHQQKISAMAIVSETSYTPDREYDMTCHQLWTRVRDLPDKQRDAILLVHSEGLNHREAAKIMDCSEATVSWHIHEARKKLKSLMGEPV